MALGNEKKSALFFCISLVFRNFASAMRLKTLLLMLFAATVGIQAQDLWELHRYDETNSTLEGHTTQILQDRDGLLWIATWNGLCRFDGYEFRRLKPQPGDGCSMSSDRIRNLWLSDDGDIYLRVDDDTCRFDTKTYRFCDLTGEEEHQRARESLNNQPTRGKHKDGYFCYKDPQGLEWQTRDDALYCMSATPQPCSPLPMQREAVVRCLQKDSKGRVWVTTREDATVRLLDSGGNELGYLTADGRLARGYQTFGHPVYCITQTHSGRIWLGCKPGGLYRLTETAANRFIVEPVAGLPNDQVYAVAEDRQGRLWIATLGGGIACIEDADGAHPQVIGHVADYPQDVCQKVRHILITPDNILLAATTEGLIVGRIEEDVKNMRFHRHKKESHRQESLSCNATMDLVRTPDGRLFVATETGGICEVVSNDLLADTLCFRHLTMQNGMLPTDMAIGMTLADDSLLMVVCPRQLVCLDINRGTYENLDHHFFHQIYRFTEGRPLLLDDDRWLIPTLQGAVWLPRHLAHRSNYTPPLLLTSITVLHGQGLDDTENLAVTRMDTLRLGPSERSITVRFAALDYIDPSAVNYQFRLDNDSVNWTSLGHNHSITLLDLSPGTYQLAIRSTNSDGVWTSNTRTLTIIVTPTFWESAWGRLLMVLLIIGIVAAIAYTSYYIRRIKRQQHETLEAYLALLDKVEGEQEVPQTKQTDDPFMQQVLAFVEQNMGNSNADVNQMAEACAVSRSVLQRKMKQLMGVTPADFFKEARIKHACLLLKNDDSIVSEVAYKCGFSDPKYFSRCFRQSVGVSPSEYKNQVRKVD